MLKPDRDSRPSLREGRSIMIFFGKTKLKSRKFDKDIKNKLLATFVMTLSVCLSE